MIVSRHDCWWWADKAVILYRECINGAVLMSGVVG